MNDEHFQCQILRASRNRLLRIIEENDCGTLFEIPTGFNNNIIWQIGHCITSQQRHMYMRSGLPMYISTAFMQAFKIGSSPAKWTINPDINEVKHLLIQTVDHLESDLESKLFLTYEPFDLPIGFQVQNHLHALQAANYHEAEHSGKVLMYLKMLGNNNGF